MESKASQSRSQVKMREKPASIFVTSTNYCNVLQPIRIARTRA